MLHPVIPDSEYLKDLDDEGKKVFFEMKARFAAGGIAHSEANLHYSQGDAGVILCNGEFAFPNFGDWWEHFGDYCC